VLTAKPKRWASWDYEIFESGSLVAKLELAWLRERGTLRLQGGTFEIGRDGLAHGAFYLRKDGETIVSATKPSLFFRAFDIVLGQARYRLEAAALFGRTFVLREGRRVVGSIKPLRLFSRNAAVDLPVELPLEVQVFITWLVVVLWKRQASS
jgi:hypothetical protein